MIREAIYICDFSNERIRKVDKDGIITTVAGTGVTGYNGDGGRADTSQLHEAQGICTDQNDNLYIADVFNFRIRKVDTSGIITTVIGNGHLGSGGDFGAATDASIFATVITSDDFGNLFIAGSSTSSPYNTVRLITSSGIITTFAGSGDLGFSGDGGLAIDAEINLTFALTTDFCGNLYIADDSDCCIRKVTLPYCGYLTVNELQSAPLLTISPNPASTSLVLTSRDEIKKITITNMMGKVVYTGIYNSLQVEVDVSHLPTGAYFVKVNDITNGKFLKQ